ncbi:MAG TPA: hypothetical protein VLV78_01515 [Thermoanaerobaculia bacterium]|nr:hypothetical protein [Thermoanaerobaculia bacterium]
MSLLPVLALLAATAFPVLSPVETPIVRGPIAPTSGGDYPAVATDGTNFLVVSGPFAMLVDRDGNPLLPTSVVMPSNPSVTPGIASSGATYLVATGGGKAALLDRSGSLLKIIDLGPVADTESSPDIAWDGSRYIAVQQTEPQAGHPSILLEYTATMISNSGEVLARNAGVAGNRVAVCHGFAVFLSENAPIFDTAGHHAEIIAGDDGFLAVWQAFDYSRVMGRHLDPSGAPDSDVFVIASGTNRTPIRGAWTGRDYVVVIAAPTPLVIHVTRSGASGPPAKIGDFETYAADVAWNGESLLVAWSNRAFPPPPFSIGFSTHAGRMEQHALLTNNIVHRQHDQQGDPLLATTGVGLFAAWNEYGEIDGVPHGGVAASFVTASGGGPRIPVAPNTGLVAVAGAPSSALVVHFDGKLRATVVLPDGTIRPPVFLASEINGSVAATWTGREYLVTWAQPLITVGWSIDALRISQDGTVVDTAPRHIADTFRTGSLAVGSSGRSALIVDSDMIGGPLRGSLVDDSVKRIETIAGPGDLHEGLNVASDGAGFLVTWFTPRTGTIRGRRIAANGEPTGEVRDYAQVRAQRLFTFWTGENYLLVWTWNNEITALRVSAEREPLDRSPRLLGRLDTRALSMTSFGSSQLAIVVGTDGFDQRLALRYALAPRSRAAAHR